MVLLFKSGSDFDFFGNVCEIPTTLHCSVWLLAVKTLLWRLFSQQYDYLCEKLLAQSWGELPPHPVSCSIWIGGQEALQNHNGCEGSSDWERDHVPQEGQQSCIELLSKYRPLLTCDSHSVAKLKFSSNISIVTSVLIEWSKPNKNETRWRKASICFCKTPLRCDLHTIQLSIYKCTSVQVGGF